MRRHFFRAPRRRVSWSRNRVAQIQQLEPRTLPTTSVLNVVQSGNNLTLTGDDQSNAVTVEITTSGVTITAGAGTSLTLNAVAQIGAITIPVVAGAPLGDMTINLGGGNDTLGVNVDAGLGARSLKSLSVNAGDEDDNVMLEVGSGTTLNVSGAVALSTGEGQDKLDLNLAGIVTVGGTLSIDTGADADAAAINLSGSLDVVKAASFVTGDGVDSLTITGDGFALFESTLTINTGEDADTLAVALNGGLTSKGTATVTTGNGDDQITFTNNHSTLDFQKGLLIDMGVDADTLTIAGESGTLHSGGDLKIITGSSDDVVTLSENLLVDGSFNVNTGDGRDGVIINTATGVGNIASLMKGNLVIDTGSGADILSVTVANQTSLAINGTATITTGSGDDQVTLTNTASTLTFAKGLTIDTGTGTASGTDSVIVSGGNLTVTGTFKISTGAQNDSVMVSEAMTVSGDLNLDTGTGADVVQLNLLGTSIGTTIPPAVDNSLGSLTVNTGTGADVFTLATASSATTKILGSTTINTGNGNDNVSITANGALTFVKDLTINTGLNEDRVRIEAATGSIRLNANEAVNLGDQNDCFLQGTTAAINAALNPLAAVTAAVTFQIDGNLGLLGGNGADTIGSAGIQVGKDRPSPTAALPASTTTIDGGAGNDVIGLFQNVVRDLKIIGGDGNDTFGGQDLTIRGTTNVDLGIGNDRLLIGDIASLNDNVTVSGGSGDDQLAIGKFVTLAAGKKIALNGGTGANVLKNDSTIPGTALNPAPVNWPTGSVDDVAISKLILSALHACFPK